MTHNGYPNCETWYVALWVDNDEWAQEEVLREATERAGEHAWLREWVENNLLREEDSTPQTGLAADLLNAAMGSVDWCYLEDQYYKQATDE